MRAAILENLHIGDIENGHVLAQSVRRILVEFVPSVYIGLIVGCVTDAVPFISGTGTLGTVSVWRYQLRKGGLRGISALTFASLVGIQILFADKGFPVNRIRRIFFAQHQEGVSLKDNIFGDHAAILDGSDRPGRQSTIDRVGIGRTCRFVQGNHVNEIGPVLGFLQENDEVFLFDKDGIGIYTTLIGADWNGIANIIALPQ